jgi:flagellar export protein FliJ
MLRVARVREQRARRDLERARSGVLSVEDRLREMARLQEQTEATFGEPRDAGHLQLLGLGRIGYQAQRSATREVLRQATDARDTRFEEHRASVNEQRTRERVLEHVLSEWRKNILADEQRELDEFSGHAFSTRDEADE